MSGTFDDLLLVQDSDLVADQLRHRRANLTQRAALRELLTTERQLTSRLVEVDARLEELGRDQYALESEIALVAERIATEDHKLYGGSITAPRELEALQAELVVLGRRRDELEDRLLAVMEAGDEPTAEQARLSAERGEIQAASGRLADEVAALEAAIDAELAEVEAQRAGSVASLPTDLVDRYERLRQKLGGVGAARLEGGRCTGCHLALPATELDAIRHAAPDALVVHEECGRILVH